MASSTEPRGERIKPPPRAFIAASLFPLAHGAGNAGGEYPLHRAWGGVKSHWVTFFRKSEENGYAIIENPFHADVVSVAALNNPAVINTPHGFRLTRDDSEYTKMRMRTIFRIHGAHGLDRGALVLGAFGCGAFRNPPEHIAKLFHEVMDEPEFHGRIRRIVFAIIDEHFASSNPYAPEGNFIPFAREFAGLGA